MVPKVIGIAGRAKAGKDVCADYLCREFGYRKVSVAGPIRDEYEEFITAALWNEAKHRDYPDSFRLVVQAYRTAVWNKPTSPEMRVALQWYGTDYRREQNAEYWNSALLAEISAGDQVVISDVRDPTEVRAIHSVGGEVWFIEGRATSLSPVGIPQHRTETALLSVDCDRIVANTGTIEQLYAKLDFIVRFC